VRSRLSVVSVVLGIAVLLFLSGCMLVNSPPVASFTRTPSSGTAPLNVTFSAAASRDSDGTITGYAWNFGDGGTGAGSSTSHIYQTAGNYTAVLRITDDDGDIDTTSRSIIVTGSSTPPTSGADYSLTAAQLLDEYDANEVAADLKYKGKLLAVTGYIDNITSYSTSLGVWLAPSQGWALITVNCYFPLSAQQQIAQLSEGQQITVVGVCGGEGIFGVRLRECYIQ
jgi:PKD repeat protein